MSRTKKLAGLGIAAAAGGAAALWVRSRPEEEMPVVSRYLGVDVVRTPEAAFHELDGYDFEPNYVEVDGLRMHYVDAGPRDGEVVLLLHGEPTWSYLYRKMIPVLASAGLRAIAPDLIGFGKSDKLASVEAYTPNRHQAWMDDFVAALGLKEMTLVCQDWGSLIGLRMVGEHADLFERVVVANGFLPDGSDTEPPAAYKAWKAFASNSPVFPVGGIVQAGTATLLSNSVLAGYNAPFPSAKFKCGARAFPSIVPMQPGMEGVVESVAAWEGLLAFDKPFLTAFGTRDPILGSYDTLLQERVPGADGQPHQRLGGAGHFVQEDRGVDLAEIIVDFIKANPKGSK